MSCSRSGEAGYRRGGGDSSDRLSDLPDSVIHHILSFLDTKYSVQTSVLSRRWRCVWESVPVLNLNVTSFGYCYNQFSRFVDKVLSLHRPLTVSEISYCSGGAYEYDEVEEHYNPYVDDPLVARVSEYAVSHGTRRLMLELYSDSDYVCDYRFPDPPGSMLGCNLEILELSCFSIDERFASLGFELLTRLELVRCTFWTGQEFVDPFSKFPCLKDLVLQNSHREDYHGRMTLRISGPQLRNLTLIDVNVDGIEVSAPKLECFKLHDAANSFKFSELCLPSLSHVDIRGCYWLGDVKKEEWVFLFESFHNVKSLTLCGLIIEALCKISDVLEQQPSPFARIETLKLRSPENIPYKLMGYFLKRTSFANPSLRIVE